MAGRKAASGDETSGDEAPPGTPGTACAHCDGTGRIVRAIGGG